MSKFCGNCGNQMPDDAVVCGNCGSALDNGAAPADNVNVGALKEKAPLLAAAVAVLLVLIIIIASVAGGGYKKALKKNMAMSFKGQVKHMEKLAPKEVWEYIEDEADMDIKDLQEEYEDSWDDIEDSLEDEYGKNIRASFKITDKDKVDKDDLKEIKDSLKDNYDIAKKDVKKAYELEVDITVKGKDDEDTEDVDLYAVKIGSKWYILSAGGSFMPSLYGYFY